MPAITKLFRAAKALPPKEHLTAIRKIFHTLLWTACVEVHRGKVPPPPGVEDWWSLPPEWTAEKFEVKYGVGHYEDRKIQLHDALDALLKKGVAVEPVYRILSTARFKLASWYDTENEFDACRVVETERQTLQKWIDRWQRLQSLEQTISAQPVARGLAAKHQHKPLQNTPYRRPRVGPKSPQTEIIRPTLKALAAAGVIGWPRPTLLYVTGITLHDPAR